MAQLTRDKFRRSKELRERLKLTGTKQLINTVSVAGVSRQDLEERLYWG
jgi:hypothetical protein